MKIKKNIKYLLFLSILYTQDWTIQIKVEIDAFDGGFDFPQDVENYLGVDSLATDGFDINGLDLPEPPPNPGNYIQFYFPHPEWNSDFGQNFTQDIRLNDENLNSFVGKTWNGEIYSNCFGLTNMELELHENFPNCDYKVLIDEDEYINQNLISIDINAYSAKEVEIKVYNCEEELNTEIINIPKKLDMQIYPNPFNGNTTISYEINNNEKINLSVFSLKGETVFSQNNINRQGKRFFNISSEKLKSGIYFVKLESKNIIETKKIIILK